MDQPAKNCSKVEYLALGGLLIVYLVVALAHAYLAPLTIGPDELAHYEYMNFIAQQGRLPWTRLEREEASYKSDQPPLYHLISSIPASLVDITGPPYLKRVRDHERRQLIERVRHAWGLYNTEDEQWPYQGEVLRWQVGRWVAIFFGAMTIIMTFYIAREVFASRPETDRGHRSWLPALSAAAVVAFIPRFALTGSMLNYETTVAFFASLSLWVLLRITHRNKLTFYALLLGLFSGLSITTKLSALILPVEILVALWFIGRSYGWPWRMWIRLALTALLATLVAVSWWFGFVLYHFNTIADEGWWTGLLRPLIAADPSDATTNHLLSFLTDGQAGFTGPIEEPVSGPSWQWLALFFRTFWVVGIESQQPLGLFGLLVALGLCLLAASGLITAWRQSRERSLVLLLLLLHLFLPFVLPMIRYATTLSLADTAQGRHVLFLAAPAFATLLMWGLCQVSSIKCQVSSIKSSTSPPSSPFFLFLSPIFLRFTFYVLRFIYLIPAPFLLFWSGIQLWTMSWAYPPPLPVSTMPVTEAQGISLNVHHPFNEFVTLRGFKSQLGPTPGRLQVDLWWQATAVSPVDYLTELTLRDAQGQVQSQWLGYPAAGRYPTRAWDIGDIVRDTAWLPVDVLPPGQYSLTVNLLAMTVANVLNEHLSWPSSHPLTLEAVTLPTQTEDSSTQNFLAPQGAEAAARRYTIWAEDVPFWTEGDSLAEPRLFRYRETLLVTLNPLSRQREWQAYIVGPDNSERKLEFTPIRQSASQAIFIVGPDWTTGDYRLQMKFADPEQVVSTAPLIQIIDRWKRVFERPAMQRRVEANFANQVKLLGYDLLANRVEPGGGVPVTLYWQGLDWMGEDYTIFTKLFAADQTVHGGRDRLPREGYRTLYWAPAEIISDPFGAPVDVDAPAGVYYLNIGLYKLIGEQAHSLPLVQDGQPLDASSINIGPIKIGDAPSGLILETARPQIPLNQSFGETPSLTLLGYDLTDENAQPISNAFSGTPQLPISNYQLPMRSLERPNLHLTLYWRSEAILPLDYTTFVHLRNQAGENVAQKDQPPLQGAYPTSLWDPGEIIADEVIVPLPPELDGHYELVIGMYDFKSGARLPIPGQPDNSLLLTQLELE
jgi:4-amino-4-deoxy-L-arabinose transferase-like glycosyltransferase